MSRQDVIRAQHRNQFQQRQQVNRNYAQRLQQGMTPGQAATQPYTVTDSDTLETIASANGVNPVDVLAANPELKQVRTGMVLNAPQSPALPGSEAWRAQNISGGMGLPSNAALGGTTTNPQGNNPFSNLTGSTGFNQQQTTRPDSFGRPRQGADAFRTNQPAYPQYANSVKAAQNTPYQPYPLYAQNQQQNPAAAAIQATTPQTNTSTPAPFGQGYQYMSRNLYHQQIRTRVDNAGYMPTPGELNILETMGYITKDPTASGGGGFGGYSRRRGGGGGGGKRPRQVGMGGGGGVPREPAFSSGSGFGGLVNWRI